MADNNGKNGYLVGVDYGGTKILGGIFDSSLRLVATAKTSAKAQRGPEVVVLGGGVMAALADEMLGIIVETARDYAMPGVMKNLEIMASLLGDNAGITGAAVLVKRLTK
jgi:glucokinase